MRLFFLLALLLSGCSGSNGASTAGDGTDICFGLSGNWTGDQTTAFAGRSDANFRRDILQYCHFIVNGCDYSTIHSWDRGTGQAVIGSGVPAQIPVGAFCSNTSPLQTCQLTQSAPNAISLDCGTGVMNFTKTL